MSHPDDDDLIDLVDDEPSAPASEYQPREVWRVLIVDDEDDVHTATIFALEGMEVRGRPLAFAHAFSAREAREILERERDFAVILLDVVMESDDAGLQLVRLIRGELGMSDTRIILRTGQPGYAPEHDAIRDYDINDYKTKAELTRSRLVTTLTAAIRAFEQLQWVEGNRRGLARILSSLSDIMRQRSPAAFTEGVLSKLAELVEVPAEGLLCLFSGSSFEAHALVIGAAGSFRPSHGATLASVKQAGVADAIARCMRERASHFERTHACLHFRARSGHEYVAYLVLPGWLNELERQLLQIFVASLSASFDNAELIERLEKAAWTDSLTGLPNRNALVRAIDARDGLAPGAPDDRSLLLLDLAGFAEVNHALGFAQGDALLLALASRLRGKAAREQLVVRLSGDTFGVLGPSSLMVPNAWLELLRAPYSEVDYPLRMQASAGLVRVTDADGGGQGVMQAALLALHHAKKREERGLVAYEQAMSRASRERLDLLTNLRGAVASKGLALYYQPQIDLTSGRVVGAEALMRWPVEGGLIPPDRFIPVAEASGLIVEMGAWALARALTDTAAWRTNGLGDIRVGVNVSVLQFRHPGLVDEVATALSRSGLPPHLLELEITESIAMEDIATVARVLERLRSLGVGVSIDDFGMGYSSLAYLHRLPFNRLKIDRAFVRQIVKGQRHGSLAETIVRMGQNLSLALIAEGIENAEQEAWLQAVGCQEGQGFLYSPALPTQLFEAWVRARHTALVEDEPTQP